MKYQSQYIMKGLVLFGVFCVLASSVSAAAGPRAEVGRIREEFMPPTGEGKTWKLAWSDEFNGTKIDKSKWEILGDWKRRDGYWVKEDSYLDGKGNLIIRTKKDGDRYTSGAMRGTNR